MIGKKLSPILIEIEQALIELIDYDFRTKK
jgi:hypothetical protein